ncbi:amino acid adenylation domain-containing protein [Streptomyces sp. MMS24-I2-30]|uniref:non-ribosomal peptide synthetase n=1 Tax=Streptomyces sp. MMS24-I2-30 TaxID=3351564 RepID=UPI0038968B0F
MITNRTSCDYAEALGRPRREPLDVRVIHEAVAHWAQSTPEAVALISDTHRVSYGQLDALADVYARELADLGVGSGHVVPVVLPRSSGLVAVLLAILKCGAAYAALDQRWPVERIDAITGVLDTPLLITDAPGPGRWSPTTYSTEAATRPDFRPVETAVSPTAAASVFFTSGTTGTPKGVVAPHHATTRLFTSEGFAASFGPGRVMPQAAPVSWDAFSLELWGMLTTGGTCALVQSDYFLPDDLMNLVRNEGVNTLWLTTSLFNLFVDENVDCFSGVTQVLTGGERLSAAHARAFLAANPEVILLNGYGPVESCIFATAHSVSRADCDRPDGVPIGRPVPGTTVHVLDGGTRLEAGSIGEICIAGNGLADGYLHNEQATTAAFVTMDIDGEPTRMYRTGDRGMLDEDGVLHFRGRSDRQVKIAGHRIEPAEVEAAARQVPAVADCAVIPVPKPDGGGYEHLAMFYTPTDPQGSDDPESVRAALAVVHPRHLVPAVVRRRTVLPRTLNGKVDRATLLAALTPLLAPGASESVAYSRENAAAAEYPMSFEQESIWLNDQMQQGASRYLESWVNRLRGSVDTGAIQEALNGIVARHESLRSRLVMTQGRPVQQVLPSASVPLAVREVTEDGLEAALREAVSQPVELSEPPLLRATLLRIAENDTVLAVRVHHAVIDGWCFSLLDQELSELYRQALDNSRTPLAGVPLQFGPYAAAQRADGGQARAEALSYWKENLACGPEESTFPADRPRPDVLGAGGDQIEFTIGAALGCDIRSLSRRLRTTPFVVMASALGVLIGRHTGQDDVVIGTPISRRDTTEVAGMIACLTDIMPLRQRLAPDLPFRKLVDFTKETIWSAIRYKDLPYGHLVRESDVERTLDRFPLFQVVFTLDDAPAPNLDLPGVDAERLYVHSGTAKFDVFLTLKPAGDGFLGLWEFSTDLFDAATAKRLAAGLCTLLENVVNDPNCPVADLGVLPPEERAQLARWAQDADAPEAPVLAHEHVRRWARKQPWAVAVRGSGQELSYAELDHRSGAVAAHLINRGLRGAAVGVCVERSLDLPVAVLGVLKAGGAYVPVDPAYPAERIAFMTEDSGVRAVLTQRDLVGRTAIPASVERLLMDEIPETRRSTDVSVTVDDLAYLIYTSGSTGRPKGVAMPHGPLANLLDWQCHRSTAGPGTRSMQFASLSFDVAFQELFSTWATGGTLVLVDDELRRDPDKLLGFITEEGIQRLFLPFVALQQLAEYACATRRRCDSLTEVITAGEQLQTTPAVRQFFSSLCSATLDNQYGPSETHVVTAELLSGDPDSWPELPAIGRPIAGARITLMDERLRPVPTGAVGELCVGGPVLARGYLNQPELTAEKFVHTAEGRLYRTGDLARFLPDGRIQCLGRRDDQVKIRGHRVETGEVEAALRAVPGVADAVVVVQGLGPNAGRRLIAYYLPGSEVQPPASDTLQPALRRQLPDYMVPAPCIALDAFPLTSSGKVDRKALAARQPEDVDRSVDASVIPDTPTEKAIARIWTQLLGLDRIGVRDDFFALGGNSLLATRMVLAMRTELGVSVALQAVFSAPTVAGLAELLDRGDKTSPAGPDLLAARRLAADIAPAGELVTVSPDPQHVLLTGATGFLGAFMLRDLLRHTRATVHCLIRARDKEHAFARLRSTLEQYGLWDLVPKERITTVVGDLAAPRLGLQAEDFDHLARTADAVYHPGAAVNLVFSYAQLRDANVGGTEEVLRLAALHRTVPVHHVSTVGVFTSEEHGRVIDVETTTGPGTALEHGYTQSKWVAEGLIEEARSRGLPVSLYRPTRIFGDSVTGACQSSDFVWLILKACVQAQGAPAGVEAAFDLAPVNYVSERIVALSRQASAVSGTFHLAAGDLTRLDTAVGWLRRAGYAIADLEPWEWLARIQADPANAAFPLLSTMAAEIEGAGSEGGLVYDTSATHRALDGTGIDCPAVNEELFSIYLDYFTRSGFLPSPSATP